MKTFIKMLNKMELNIEPCGILDKSIQKTLSVSFIFTPCFLRFKYDTKVTASSDKPFAWSFTSSKSWGIQSKVLRDP